MPTPFKINASFLLLAKRMAEFIEKNPLHGFEPNPMQKKFFASQARTRVLTAGNQSGKTTSGIAEDIAWMLGYRPWLKPDDPLYRTPIRPPVRLRLIVKDYDIAVKDTIAPAFEEWLPNLAKREDFAIEKHYGTGALNKITYKPNGSRIHIISHKQEGKAAGGVFDGLHIDEPCPEKIYKESSRGMITKSGYTWFTLTPVNDTPEDARYIGWLYDQIYAKADGKRIEIIEGSTYDNVGYGATLEQVKEWQATQRDNNDVLTRVFGKFSHLAGVVYKEFHPVVCNLSEEKFPKLAEKGTAANLWPRYIGIDPHPEKGHFAVFHAISPDGDVYIYDCAHLDNVREFTELLIAKEPMLNDAWGSRLCTVVVDPSFMESGGWVSGNSFDVEMMTWGIKAAIHKGLKFPGSVSQGIQIVRNHLAERRVWYHEDKCEPLFHEFMRYIWGPGGKPLKKHDDFLDAHRMVIQYGPQFYGVDKPKETRYGRRDRRGTPPVEGATWEDRFGYGM